MIKVDIALVNVKKGMIVYESSSGNIELVAVEDAHDTYSCRFICKNNNNQDSYHLITDTNIKLFTISESTKIDIALKDIKKGMTVFEINKDYKLIAIDDAHVSGIECHFESKGSDKLVRCYHAKDYEHYGPRLYTIEE